MDSPYNAFAWFYERYWAEPFQEWQAPALKRLLFPELGNGARILDLCCGTGDLARRLTERGYATMGVDSSEEMLRFARAKVPNARFVNRDAAGFTVEDRMDSVVCTFDSVNHLVETGRVAAMFACVHAVLKPGGHFVFDINTEEAYGERWDETACVVAADHAFFLRGKFDKASRIGITMVTMFRRLEEWERSDVEVRQKPFEVGKIEELLATAGFGGIQSYRAREDLGMNGHYGEGRVYFRACTS